MERRIDFQPAYDKRHKDPNKNYGLGSVKLLFILIGELGAVQFVIHTGWIPKKWNVPMSPFLPLAADVGYHSPKPIYESQYFMDCHLLSEGKCYYDGSGLEAEKVYEEILLLKGSDGVWEYLEEYYEDTFGELK